MSWTEAFRRASGYLVALILWSLVSMALILVGWWLILDGAAAGLFEEAEAGKIVIGVILAIVGYVLWLLAFLAVFIKSLTDSIGDRISDQLADAASGTSPRTPEPTTA